MLLIASRATCPTSLRSAQPCSLGLYPQRRMGCGVWLSETSQVPSGHQLAASRCTPGLTGGPFSSKAVDEDILRHSCGTRCLCLSELKWAIYVHLQIPLRVLLSAPGWSQKCLWEKQVLLEAKSRNNSVLQWLGHSPRCQLLLRCISC